MVGSMSNVADANILFVKTKEIYDPDLVSKDEIVQDKALKRFYKKAEVSSEMKLMILTTVARVVIPVVITIFMSSYWCLGLLHASSASS